eukprot:TRINITY_DN65959_c5_g3_i1.p1 TRINITY_DN65959_c5_g3~~TRINITY_DN65959_c5_g3_i1.p1  ORF type:complete len:599 (+),score=240.77 TRINITY_DN65959_c5_g3_i1:2-1798(+)
MNNSGSGSGGSSSSATGGGGGSGNSRRRSGDNVLRRLRLGRSGSHGQERLSRALLSASPVNTVDYLSDAGEDDSEPGISSVLAAIAHELPSPAVSPSIEQQQEQEQRGRQVARRGRRSVVSIGRYTADSDSDEQDEEDDDEEATANDASAAIGARASTEQSIVEFVALTTPLAKQQARADDVLNAVPEYSDVSDVDSYLSDDDRWSSDLDHDATDCIKQVPMECARCWFDPCITVTLLMRWLFDLASTAWSQCRRSRGKRRRRRGSERKSHPVTGYVADPRHQADVEQAMGQPVSSSSSSITITTNDDSHNNINGRSRRSSSGTSALGVSAAMRARRNWRMRALGRRFQRDVCPCCCWCCTPKRKGRTKMERCFLVLRAFWWFAFVMLVAGTVIRMRARARLSGLLATIESADFVRCSSSPRVTQFCRMGSIKSLEYLNETYTMQVQQASQADEYDLHPSEALFLGTVHIRVLNRSMPLMKEVLCGAHIVVDYSHEPDSCRGWFYTFLTHMHDSYRRRSSHSSTRPQFGVPEGTVLQTLLIGEGGRAARENTWFQLEGSQWHPMRHPFQSVVHAMNYVQYKLTDRQVGPLGTSYYTDR